MTGRTRGGPRHLWWVYLLVTSALAVVYLTVPFTAETRWIYVVVNSTAPIATWIGLRGHVPQRRGGWLVIGLGLAFSAAGDVIFAVHTARHGTPAFPSSADVLYLFGHLTIAAGTAMLASRAGRTAFVDAAVILSPLAGIAWILVVDPTLRVGGSLTARFFAMSAPVNTLIVVYCALALALGVELRAPGVRWLLSGLVAWFVSDALYTHQGLTGSYREGGLIDLGWMAMPILLGTAALHPSMVATAPRRSAITTLTLTRALILFGAALLLPCLHLFWEPGSDTPLVLGSALSMALVAVRLAGPIHELSWRAGHDILTGLVNRSLLMDRLAPALSSMPHTPQARVGLLFCDLDHFKDVNDSLGHDAGDQLLIEISTRLRAAVGDSDVVCRLGGDEFVILMPETTEEQAAQIADRVAEYLGRPMRLADGTEFFASLSIGLRTTADRDADPDALVQDADTAMYQAKAAGRGRMVRFDAEIRAEAAQRLRIDADLRRALSHPGEIFCVYQPVFRVDDGRLSSVEALVRWRHPADGVLPPAVFVPIAEAAGTIAQVFAVVLDQSLTEQRGWFDRTGRWIPVAVNLSPRQLDQTTAQFVLTALERTGTPPDMLTLELTETGMAEPATVEAALGPLRRAGVKIAVDDFGTGYSSMARVADHGWDVVKIDRAFVAGIHRDQARTSLADAMVKMARALGMVTVAEGVDNAADLQVLARLGCEFAQGYLLSHPVGQEGILELAEVEPRESVELRPGRVEAGQLTGVELDVEGREQVV
ncbi:putative bifunctional diguanylate cyclase/phosphodiesterase [Actinoplanes sp. NPDC020271]|uniref:putative bifunctional diguanylate cyclase/phosphodiesterase n=1 Tax=Actinoplanes sp. NPDC020271 TaxID=3363896 RepID=UPI00379BC03D